jgi:hypothetical protein
MTVVEIGHWAILMSQQTLDDRVAALEREVARLARQQPVSKNWRSTLGMFADDPVMKEIIEEGRKLREQDREQTRG